MLYIILLLLFIPNINIASDEKDQSQAESENKDSNFPNIITLKDLYLKINQRPDKISNHIAIMSLSLELLDSSNYSTIEKQIDQIKDVISSYMINLSVNDLTDNDSLYKIKKILLTQINQLIHPLEIKAIYLSDINIQ